MAGPLHDGELKAETDAKEWDLLLARPFDCADLTFYAARAEPTRYEDAPGTRTSATYDSG